MSTSKCSVMSRRARTSNLNNYSLTIEYKSDKDGEQGINVRSMMSKLTMMIGRGQKDVLEMALNNLMNHPEIQNYKHLEEELAKVTAEQITANEHYETRKADIINKQNNLHVSFM